MKTKQETFDAVFQGLKSQGFHQSNNTVTGICAYRGGLDRKCAVGHLIPDDKYCRGLDAIGTVDALHTHVTECDIYGSYKDEVPYQTAKWLLSEHDNKTLTDLQDIHDCLKDPERMKAQLLQYARDNDLKLPQEA